MKRVEEHAVFAAVVGRQINMENLDEIGSHKRKGIGEYGDCEEYVVEELTLMGGGLPQRFRITDTLRKRWERGEILFRVYLFVRNGVLVGGHVFKYKLTLEERCCDTGYETSPTQQEIRLAGRILAYLSEETG